MQKLLHAHQVLICSTTSCMGKNDTLETSYIFITHMCAIIKASTSARFYVCTFGEPLFSSCHNVCMCVSWCGVCLCTLQRAVFWKCSGYGTAVCDFCGGWGGSVVRLVHCDVSCDEW